MKNLLWDAARATKQENFDDALSKMSKIDSEAVSWLLSHASPEHWAEFHFAGIHYGHLTSNIVESLNSWILKAHELPILAMLENIHHQLMDWFTAHSKLELNTKGLLVQKVANDIQKSLNDHARRYNPLKLN